MELRTAVALSMLNGGDRLRVRQWLPQSDSLPLPVTLTGSDLERADRALARAARSDLRAIAWEDESYPPALTSVIDPPAVLWIRGDTAVFARPTVAIVGSRAASAYGLAVAEQLARDLAGQGVAVVSGLARGIDSAAHRGALAGGGPTLAVLGCGVDVTYPREHGGLMREIVKIGMVLSELPPGTPPRQFHFPERNRLISGLAAVVVVVEASEKSGSLITARCALEQGREVLAVPGNVLSARNRGSHALLKDGAGLVETVDDVFQVLAGSWVAAGAAVCHTSARRGVQDPILEALEPGEALTLDELGERYSGRFDDLLTRLLMLEVQGLVTRVAGGRFVRGQSSVLP